MKVFTSKELSLMATILLAKSGSDYGGRPKKKFCSKQRIFETKTIKMTPMGNGSR